MFRIPIALKLVALTTLMILAVTVPIALNSANQLETDAIDKERLANLSLVKLIASELDAYMLSLRAKIKLVAEVAGQAGGVGPQCTNLPDSAPAAADQQEIPGNQLGELIFCQDQELINIEVWGRNETKESFRWVNHLKLSSKNLHASHLVSFRKQSIFEQKLPLKRLFSDPQSLFLTLNRLGSDFDFVSFAFPLATDATGQVTYVAVADLHIDRLLALVGRVSDREVLLVNSSGDLLVHPDSSQMRSQQSLKGHPLVAASFKDAVTARDAVFRIDSDDYVGAYAKGQSGLITVVQINKALLVEAAQVLKRDAIYIAGRVISIALFVIFLFSASLTAPIENLARLTQRLARGDFNVRAHVQSHDEVGDLARAFNQMIVGLVERDRIKTVLNKFHGSSVAQDMLAGDLVLGGSRRRVTVFFSDIRDFTKFSEAHTPEEVVEMLNEYFQVMVSIINRNHGVVDKFIGDAIMAVWGAPRSTEQDEQNAVMACLEMRKALSDLNDRRLARGQQPIKIGMGLHCGDAISGTIGSDERMEYTVIGDAVNQAARIEASTKAFGTDLLISDDLAHIVEDRFVLSLAGEVEVKGKSQALKLLKVDGYFTADGSPELVITPYSSFAEGADEKVKKIAA